MKRHHLVLAAVVVLASGCGQKSETSTSARKSDQSPVAGADSAYMAAGWKAGDAVSWEQHLRARAQNQNEYSRTQQTAR
jgi:hypothetical protein